MSAYNKLFAAIISTILIRLFLQWTGLDVVALGVGDQVRDLVSGLIDIAAAAVTGFFVWLVPNVRKEIDRLEERL